MTEIANVLAGLPACWVIALQHSTSVVGMAIAISLTCLGSSCGITCSITGDWWSEWKIELLHIQPRICFSNFTRSRTCRHRVFCLYDNRIERDFLVRVVFSMRWTCRLLRRLLLDDLREGVKEAEQEGQLSSQFSGVSRDTNGRWEAYVYFQRKKMYVFEQSTMLFFFIWPSFSVSGIGLWCDKSVAYETILTCVAKVHNREKNNIWHCRIRVSFASACRYLGSWDDDGDAARYFESIDPMLNPNSNPKPTRWHHYTHPLT